VRALRAGARLVALVAVTAGVSLAWSAGLAFQPGAQARARWRRRWYRAWARSVLAISGIELEVVGTPPHGPCLLVSNHVGYADIPVLAAASGSLFVSMAEVRRWPGLGFMAARMGTIFLQRGSKRALPGAVEALQRRLADGEVVTLFPEGGNSDGRALRPFWPALFAAPARLGAPVAWAALHYATDPADPPASRAVAWFREPIWRHAPRFLGLRGVRARVTFGAGTLRSSDRKQLARELRARVESVFEPLA
jgi:1-acyl-sn-glycerol-3-phosphate acyltransferase